MLSLKKNPGLTGILPGIAGFLIGRVIVLQFVSPVAIAFAATYLGYGRKFYITALLTFLGVSGAVNRMYTIKYVLAFAVITAANLTLKPRLHTPLAKALTAGAAALFSGLVFACLRDMSPYFTIAALIESIFTFCMSIVLQKSDIRRPRAFTPEEQISLAITSASAVVGAMSLGLGLVPGWVLLCALIMLIAHKLGGGTAGAAGLVMGITLVLCGYADGTLPAVLGLAGVIAGSVRGKTRLRTAAGFITGLAASTLYTGTPPSSAQLGSSAIGAALFMLAPQNFYFNLNTGVYDNDEYLRRARTVLSQRLFGFSESFDKLSRTFSALARPKLGIDRTDTGRLIDSISEKNCQHCSQYTLCWHENFYETYRLAYALFNACEAKNRVDISDIPKLFRNNCKNINRFVDTVNRLFEIHKLNMVWHNRIAESRGLISEQLGSVAKLIEALSTQLDLYMNFKTDLEDGIFEELTKNGIGVEQVIVLENEHGKYEVSIRPKSCPGRNSCIKELSRIASKVLGRRMRAEDNRCTYTNGGCSMRLIEEQKFRISSGVARRAKTGSPVSGDNYSFMELRGGQCLLALSDGMGSGEKAREESAAAVELLEDFIESGFEKDMAVKMINSVLVLKSDEDSFSTLDICSVDLHTGQAEFIKIGAAATYLLRDGTVQIIKSSSLPIGMLDTVDLEVSSKRLKENDIIVMVTDGLADTDENGWLSDTIKRFGGRNPQDLAEHLLAEADSLFNGYFRDDVTVLAARIWQRS